MKIRVIDFETTGDARREKGPTGICEFGYADVRVNDGVVSIGDPVAAFVNCGIPISIAARGVHHISDADVAGAIDPTRALSILMTDMEPGDMFAAHHAEFERTFFGGGSFPWICTMICAKHMFEDAPDHKNQTLRYYLGIDDLSPFSSSHFMPPHRAGPDALVTAHILAEMLKRVDRPIDLLHLTNTPVIQKTVGFGKNEGRPWSEMDDGFLQWVVDRDFSPEIKETARFHIRRIRKAGNPFGN